MLVKTIRFSIMTRNFIFENKSNKIFLLVAKKKNNFFFKKNHFKNALTKNKTPLKNTKFPPFFPLNKYKKAPKHHKKAPKHFKRTPIIIIRPLWSFLGGFLYFFMRFLYLVRKINIYGTTISWGNIFIFLKYFKLKSKEIFSLLLLSSK